MARNKRVTREGQGERPGAGQGAGLGAGLGADLGADLGAGLGAGLGADLGAGTGDLDRAIVVTAGRFAALVGVHHNTVSNWLRAGLPAQREGDVGHGRAYIDLATGFQWVLARERARTREAREHIGEGESKAAKLAAEARLKELDVEEREQRLVAVDDVESTWSQALVSFREAVMSLPGNAVQAGIIAGAREPDLEELCREALLSIAAAMDSGEEEKQ